MLKELCLTALLGLLPPLLGAEEILMEKASPTSKSPSKEQVLWTATNLAYDFDFRQDFIGPAEVSFGSGREEPIRTHYTSMHHIFTIRKYMAFLFHSGIEWNRYGFLGAEELPVSDALHALIVPVAIDFRFSQRDLIRVQAAPGYYSDMDPLDDDDFNTPFAIGYAHIFSKRVQVGMGVSVNMWRQQRILGGGGFRWQLNRRWTLKFLMPRPQVEYKVSDTVNIWAGSDFRGDTYRVGHRFGTERGAPALNSALVDYQEIRAGAGLSWRIRPLLELNVEGGMLLDREFNFHKQEIRSTSGKAPYGSIRLRYLFQIHEDKRTIPEQLHALEQELPWMRRAPAAIR